MEKTFRVRIPVEAGAFQDRRSMELVSFLAISFQQIDRLAQGSDRSQANGPTTNAGEAAIFPKTLLSLESGPARRATPSPGGLPVWAGVTWEHSAMFDWSLVNNPTSSSGPPASACQDSSVGCGRDLFPETRTDREGKHHESQT